MSFDFTKCPIRPTYTVSFDVPCIENHDQQIRLYTVIEPIDDKAILNTWADFDNNTPQRLIRHAHILASIDTPEELDDLSYRIASMFVEDPNFSPIIKMFAQNQGLGDYTFDEQKEFDINIVPGFHVLYPKELAASFLPEGWNDELVLTIDFGADENDDCSYIAYAHIEGQRVRVHLCSKQIKVSNAPCNDPECEDCEVCGQVFAHAILSDLSNKTEEIQALLISSLDKLTDGRPLPNPVRIKVVGHGKDAVLVAPGGLNEAEADAAHNILKVIQDLTDDEEE